MKKTAMIQKISIACICLCSINIYAQSFAKKTNVFGIGADIGLYNYITKVASEPKSHSSAALNKTLNVFFERGISNHLGIGLKGQYSDYFTNTDSVTHTKPSVKAFDGTLFVNAHFVRRKHLDMLAGFDIGYSIINWEARDQYISSANGGGLTYNFHIQPRFYFGNHIGMFINLAYVNYNYKNMDFKNTFTNYNDILNLSGGGVNLGVGLQARF